MSLGKKKLAEEIQILLGQVPYLVGLYQSKKLNFVDSFKEWLSQSERILTEHRQPQAAELAGIRGVVIAAERGVYETPININLRGTSRRIAASIAAIHLNNAQHILQTLLGPLRESLEEARTVIKQVLSLAAQNGLIAQHWLVKGSVSTRLQTLWESLSSTETAGAGLRHILSLVSYVDGLCLMEEILDEWTQDPQQNSQTSP